MRIGASTSPVEAAVRKTSGETGKRFFYMDFAGEVSSPCDGSQGQGAWPVQRSRIQEMEGRDRAEGAFGEPAQGGEETAGAVRSEAEKIYEAATSGRENPYGNIRQVSKVPYGHLAKDGVIEYNGVIFVCDEETNSICLGDMTDKKNVLNITLSGGGHLKVNRSSIGLLSKAAGMFTPEDLNIIMRAIAQDSKLQSVQEEIEDTKNGAGTIAEKENVEKENGEKESGSGG